MDVVELPYPVDVAPTKLMGTEGFIVSEADARESDSVPVLVSRPGERCSSFVSQKGNVFMSDATSSGYSSDLALLVTIPDAELCRSASNLPNLKGDNVSEKLHCKDVNGLSSVHRPDNAQLQQSSSKISKCSNVCSKRQRIIQLEGSMGLVGVDDVKDIGDRVCLGLKKSTTSETNHLVKEKNHTNSKRNEKRGPKVHGKSKYDTFYMKVGSASFSSASGGSNFLGAYGLKSDAHDVTKLIDDFSLIGLLDGTYKAPDLDRNKGKKETVTSETLVHSIRKAGSVLDLLRPLQPTHNQDLCIKPRTPGDVLDFPLYRPKDILELLALPPPKDLDSLLQNVLKPTRNTHDARPGKQIARGPSLRALPWSYNYSGQSRTNADMIKLSSSKNACIGRWGRIWKLAVDVGLSSNCFSNLDFLKYDDNLVPSERLKLFTSELKIAPYISGCLHWSELGSSSSAAFSSDENCPRILAAAQTLADMATTVRQDRAGLITWPKKASQKASKARKSRAIEKGHDISSSTTSILGSDNLSRNVDLSFPSKKPKLSMTEKKKDHKGPINWSTPKSFRSSPSKSPRDSIAETKHSSATIMKQSCMVPPVTRVLDSEERPRNLEIDNMVMSWHYGRRDSIAEPRARVSDKARDSEQKLTKHSCTNTIKQPCMMPPPARVSVRDNVKRDRRNW